MIILPSNKEVRELGNGYYAKETADGRRALYHDSLFKPRRWWEFLLNRPVGLATVYSDAWTKVRAGRHVDPQDHRGKARVASWDFASLPAGNIADVLVCAKLYKGDKCFGGREAHGALSSAGGTATGSYGTYAVLTDGLSLGAADSAARFLAATDFDAAGTNVIGSTIALGYSFEATTDLFLVCVNSVEAFATAGRVAGHMLIVRD